MNRLTSRATTAHRGGSLGNPAQRATATPRFAPTLAPGVQPDEPTNRPVHQTVPNDEDQDLDGLDYLVPIPQIAH